MIHLDSTLLIDLLRDTAQDVPLVTRNARDFERIPGLRLLRN